MRHHHLRYLFFIIYSLATSLPIFSNSTETNNLDIRVIQNLIEATQQSLKDQGTLLELSKKYQSSHLAFLEDSQNKQKASEMIDYSAELKSFIDEKEMAYLFSSDFLKEIEFFSQFSNPKEISAP